MLRTKISRLRFEGVVAALAVGALELGQAIVDCGSAAAADLSAREVTQTVFKAEPGVRVDFTGKDLSNLDLAGLDFKSAIMKNANLYGVDLSSANLKGVDLAGAKLDRAIVIKANFSGANLEGASIRKPSVFSSGGFDYGDVPLFEHTNLKGARISARMDGANFKGADLTTKNRTLAKRRSQS